MQSTNVAKPHKVAIIGASGTYGRGILARAEEIGVEVVVVTRLPHKFRDVKPTTTVFETQLDEEEKLREAFSGCDGVISALGGDRKKRPKTHNLPHVWNAMKAVGVTKCIGMGSGPMMMPGEKRGGFQRTVYPLLVVLKLFGVDLLEQNEWERDSLLMGKNSADGISWMLTRPVRPTETPFVGAYVHKDKRGPMNCSIYDHGDFCLYCVASSEWDKLAPHISSGPQPKKKFQTSWVDTFHMNYGIMFSEGERTKTGFVVVGKYAVAPGKPPWSWKTVFELTDEDHLTVTAYNVLLDGKEAKAIETAYTRKKP